MRFAVTLDRVLLFLRWLASQELFWILEILGCFAPAPPQGPPAPANAAAKPPATATPTIRNHNDFGSTSGRYMIWYIYMIHICQCMVIFHFFVIFHEGVAWFPPISPWCRPLVWTTWAPVAFPSRRAAAQHLRRGNGIEISGFPTNVDGIWWHSWYGMVWIFLDGDLDGIDHQNQLVTTCKLVLMSCFLMPNFTSKQRSLPAVSMPLTSRMMSSSLTPPWEKSALHLGGGICGGGMWPSDRPRDVVVQPSWAPAFEHWGWLWHSNECGIPIAPLPCWSDRWRPDTHKWAHQINGHHTRTLENGHYKKHTKTLGIAAAVGVSCSCCF